MNGAGHASLDAVVVNLVTTPATPMVVTAWEERRSSGSGLRRKKKEMKRF